MVDRASNPAEFNTGRGPSIQGTSIGNAPSDKGKFSTSGQGARVASPGLDNLLNTIVSASGKLADREVQVTQQEAYLRGSAAAGRGEEEESLQENIFTRNWASSGWRDTTGKLAAADAEAQTAVDMKTLREQSPEEFQKYLAQRRTKLMPKMEGMSFEARKGMLAQQLTSERAAIKQHGMAHAQWIIDQQTKAIQTSVSVSFDGLDAVKASAPAYKAGVDSAFANVYSNVWLNPNLPEDMRIKLAGEAMSGALARDHQQLYEKFKTTPVKTASGENATMFSQLPFDDQVKLAGDYRTSRQRTITARSAQHEIQAGLMEASWDDPTKPLQPWSEVAAFMDEAEQQGLLKEGQRKTWAKSWADANQKKHASDGIALDYQTGNLQGLFNKNVDEGQAFQGWMRSKAMAGTPVAQVVGEALAIGKNHGFQSAFKGVGELTRPAVQQLFAAEPGPGNAQNAQMVKTVLDTIDRADAGGKSGALTSYLSGFDDSTKSMILGYQDRVRMGIDPVSAAAQVRQLADLTAGLDTPTRNAMAAANAKSDAEALASITTKQLMGTMGSEVASWVSADAAGRKALSNTRAWLENEERVAAGLAPSRMAVAEELQYLGRSHPYATGAERTSMALANVAARTLQTQSGPLVMPRALPGTTLQSQFGVGVSVMPETIGKAIDTVYGPKTKGGRMAYQAYNGQITAIEYNTKGGLTSSVTFDPKSMGQAIADQEQKRTDKFQAESGAGITIKGKDGTPITFNGATTTSIDPVKMLEFRKTLIRDEDVKAIPYPDLSGRINRKTKKPIMTVGAGISDTNTYYPKPGADGSISQKDINESFMKATDEAARGAAQVFQGYIGGNRKLEMLMMTLAYQSGPNFAGPRPQTISGVRPKDANGIPMFTGNYGDFINNAIRGDKAAATVALKASPAYRASGESRRKHYLDMLNNAME